MHVSHSKRFGPIVCTALALATCTTAKPAATLQDNPTTGTTHEHINHDTSPAVHGMVLFGRDALFISHIPTFGIPHDWQAFIEVEISHPSLDALAIFHQQRENGLQRLVTLKPAPFVLPKLLRGDLKQFTASMHKGNFEENGPVVLSNVTVTVRQILMTTHLSPKNEAVKTLEYVPVISGKNGYLAHRISAPSNFDHIVEVKLDGTAVPTVIDPKRSIVFKNSDQINGRLAKGKSFDVKSSGDTFQATPVDPTSPLIEGSSRMTIISDFYCTPGPDFFGSC